MPLLFCIVPVKASPTYEDFTTYTEVDTEDDRIQFNSTHIDHKGYRNEDTYLYKDYGVNRFGNFEHLIDVKAVNHGASTYGASYVWMLSIDTVDDFKGIIDSSKTSIGVAIWYSSTIGFYLLIEEAYEGARYVSSVPHIVLTGNVMYYLKIVKSGTSLTLYVYDDEARTNLFGTKNLVLHYDHQCRYIFNSNTYNDNTDSGKWVDVDIENLDICEIVSLTFFFMEGGQFRIDNATLTNGTKREYGEGSVVILEFQALPFNASWVFLNFTWDSSYNDTNPYAFNETIYSNMTVWCIFKDPPLKGKTPLLFVGLAVVGALIAIPLLIALSKRRRR